MPDTPQPTMPPNTPKPTEYPTSRKPMTSSPSNSPVTSKPSHQPSSKRPTSPNPSSQPITLLPTTTSPTRATTTTSTTIATTTSSTTSTGSINGVFYIDWNISKYVFASLTITFAPYFTLTIGLILCFCIRIIDAFKIVLAQLHAEVWSLHGQQVTKQLNYAVVQCIGSHSTNVSSKVTLACCNAWNDLLMVICCSHFAWIFPHKYNRLKYTYFTITNHNAIRETNKYTNYTWLVIFDHSVICHAIQTTHNMPSLLPS